MEEDHLIEKGRNLNVSTQETVWLIVGTQLLKGKVEKSRDAR